MQSCPGGVALYFIGRATLEGAGAAHAIAQHSTPVLSLRSTPAHPRFIFRQSDLSGS